MKRFFTLTLTHITLLAVALVSFTQVALAEANATVTVAVDKATYTVGEQVQVTVNGTVSEFTAGAVELAMNYSPATLEYVSHTGQGGLFPNQNAFNHDAATGTLSFILMPPTKTGSTGSGKIVSVVLKAKAAGSANLSFNQAVTKVYETFTGHAKPTNSSSTAAFTVTSVVTPPPPTPTPTPVVVVTPPPATPTPAVGGNPSTTPPSSNNNQSNNNNSSNNSSSSSSSSSTAKKTPTPRAAVRTTPRATTKATPNPSATPGQVSTSGISASKSTVEYSSTTAQANGEDTITITVTLRKEDGSIVNNIAPTVTGLRENSDVASPFTYDEIIEAWTSQVTSTEPGILSATINAENITLGTQDLTFTEPTPTDLPTDVETQTSSFGRTLLIGLLLLILLLIILFFLWRRLRKNDDDLYGAGGYAGSEDQPAPEGGAAAPAEENKDDVANFSPTEALARSAPPPAEAAAPAPTPPAETPPPAAEPSATPIPPVVADTDKEEKKES